MAVLEIILAAVAIFLVIFLRYLLKNRGYLESLGIPIVKPGFIFGSPPYFPHKILIHEQTNETFKKLGKTWGRYDGRSPCILTIDPELVKCIMIKNFDCFSDTVEWEMPDNKITLDLSGGEKWKALRKVLSPTFTSGKLKSMLEPMDAVVDNLLKHLDQEVAKNPVVRIKSIFQNFSLDTISVCAFGIGVNSFEHEESQILKWGKDMFSVILSKSWVDSLFIFIVQHFTFLTKFMNIYPESYDKLYLVTKQIMEERTSKNIEKEDFIGKLNRIMKNPEPPLTPEIIIAQGVIFFAAGFETTSSTLSTFSYNLAKHPEVQVIVNLNFLKLNLIKRCKIICS